MESPIVGNLAYFITHLLWSDVVWPEMITLSGDYRLFKINSYVAIFSKKCLKKCKIKPMIKNMFKNRLQISSKVLSQTIPKANNKI